MEYRLKMRDLLTLKEKGMSIQDAIKEITQSRSKYQIERFVIGQHHSLEMQYYQLCLEASGLIDAIKESELRIKKIGR